MEAILFAFVIVVTSLFLLSVYRINKGKKDNLGLFAFRRADEESDQPPGPGR